MDYSIILISNKPHKFDNIAKTLSPEKVHFFNGTGYQTFSKLVNDAVRSSLTETVIIMSDKVLPTQEHIKKVLDLLDKGYGFVSLSRFAFFGFRKELFRQIGFFDERYIGGGWEDFDFVVRLIESNVSSYIVEELEYNDGPSIWNRHFSHKHWVCKWTFCQYPDNRPPKIIRNMPEPDYKYDLGPSTGIKWLPNVGHSNVVSHLISPYYTMYFEDEKPNDYSVFCLADNVDVYKTIQEKLPNERLWYYKTYDEHSLSKLINNCMEQSPNELVIMFTEFITPTHDQIQKMVSLLRKGYGFVGMQGFSFFGINKELLRNIGMFDERYIPSGQESEDIFNRIKEHGYSFYFTNEVKSIQTFCDWLAAQHRWNGQSEFHKAKWNNEHRLSPDQIYNYRLGPSTGAKLLKKTDNV